MSFNPKTIAKEWSHRISTGMPNPKSKWHVEKLGKRACCTLTLECNLLNLFYV